MHFAEIAGVFVGFGALLSLRSARPTDPHDVVYIRIAASSTINRSRERLDRPSPFVGLPLDVLLAGSQVLIVSGVWPGIDEAPYITALPAGVIFAGYALLMSGMSRTDAPAPDQDGL